MPDKFYSMEEINKRIGKRLKRPAVPLIQRLKTAALRLPKLKLPKGL